MVARIALFAWPESEEEAQADSDVEPLSVPKSKRDEASLRAEAVSIEHMLTHRPKNAFCPFCQRAKMSSSIRLANMASWGARPMRRR